MVYHHFSSQLAQSFRPGHHLNSLRNALPSNPGSASSNLFGSAGNSVGGGSAQAAGAGAGGTAGGAGGAKWHAGSRAGEWSYQSHGRILAQSQGVTTDSNTRANDDEREEALRKRRAFAARSRNDLHRQFQQRRRNSLLSSSDRPELLNVEESGLSSVRLSSAEMQKRYRSAFSRNLARAEEERQVSEESEPAGGASFQVAEIARRVVASATRTAPARRLHTSARPFSSSSPPEADVPSRRRYSTSAAETPTAALADEPASAPPTATLAPPQPTAPVKKQQPPRSPSPRAPPARRTTWATDEFPSPEALDRYSQIVAARQSGDVARVRSAVRHYLGFEADLNIKSHHAAIDALTTVRVPDTPIGKIVELYNQMFDHAALTPSTRTFELVMTAFCKRDREILEAIRFLERRATLRLETGKARGPWHTNIDNESNSSPYLAEQEQAELAALAGQDYFTPALKIYKTLGAQADQLKVSVVNQLLGTAVLRKRIELALSIFARLEKSRFDQPNAQTYEILIRMLGDDKDAEGVKEVFDAYLAARERGLPAPRTAKLEGEETMYTRIGTKHAFTVSPTYAMAASDKAFYNKGDEAVWKTTIRSAFAAGDSVGAVELIERMIAAQSLPGGPPRGYPAQISGLSTSAIVAGFLGMGDYDSARRWFDRMDNPAPVAGTPAEVLPTVFYRIVFYAAISASHVESANHIYRAWLNKVNKTTVTLSIADTMAVIKVNLVEAYSPDASVGNRAIDAILDIKQRFSEAVASGRIHGADKTFSLSTGVSGRITQALAYVGRYDEAAAQYVEYVEAAVKTDILVPNSQSTRSVQEWINSLTKGCAAAALGLRSVEGEIKYAYPDAQRPGVAGAAKVAAKVRALQGIIQHDAARWVSQAVVESYLTQKAAGADPASLGLDAQQWQSIVESFATVAGQHSGLTVATLPFPGFESIIDDFTAAGAQFGRQANLVGLVKALRAIMPESEIVAVLSLLSPVVAEQLAQGITNLSALITLITPVAPVAPVAPAAATIRSPTPSRDLAGVAALNPSRSLAEQPPTTLPSPPATPPPYFTEITPTPAGATLNHPLDSFDAALTKQVGDLLAINPRAAYDLVLASWAEGGFPHPDVLSRLVEVLGREGEIDRTREIYLLAYSVLPAFAHDPAAQSVMWVTLEDRMIIALCHVGALTQVAVHRDRLIQAGSAPSADGYAAMINNMNETTDDASVARELFEESQRYNVAPNVYLFNTLISKLSRARRAADALSYFEFMKQCSLKPSSITYGAIINSCCKIGDDKTAEFLFHEMVNAPGFRPRVPPYNTMMQFYTQTKPDRERALFYYDQLKAAGVKPSDHTYKLLLDVYGSVGVPDPLSLTEVFNLLAADPSVVVTGAHWASLINSWGTAQKDLDFAIGLFNSIAAHSSTLRSKASLPDAVVYESLLNAFLANHRPDLCKKYLDQMKERGIRMTAYVANTLIKGHASQGNLAEARAVFESLDDPPAGYAATANHAPHRQPQRPNQPPAPVYTINDPVYREPSTWETMIRVELAADELQRAVALVKRLEMRAFPEAVVSRIRKLLTDLGAETLPLTPTPEPYPSPVTSATSTL